MALDNPSYFSLLNKPPKSSPTSSTSTIMTASVESSPKSLCRRSLRTLMRSLSSEDQDSLSILMGKPRLSDMAPEFNNLPEPRRANSLKCQYSPLPTTSSDSPLFDDNDPRDDEDEEVFLNHREPDSVKYYNVKSARLRRHSISTFRPLNANCKSAEVQVHRDGKSSSSLINSINSSSDLKRGNDENSIHDIEHRLRHGSYPRKWCSRCPRGIKRQSNMEDILIISAKNSEPATLWAQYFTQYFQQVCKSTNRKAYKIHHLGIEEVISLKGDVQLVAEKTACVKLQIIIVCPLLLDLIEQNREFVKSLAKILMTDRILALQLGTTDSDITDIHKESLVSFQNWQRRPVGQDQDQTFAHEFVTLAMGIFSKVWKQQSLIATEENSQFSVSPKKIRMGQTSILILLTYPLQKEDIVKITIVKNDDLTELAAKAVKVRNPYTLKVTIPEKFLEVSAIVNVLVEKNGSFIGRRPVKCESRLRELEQILRATNNPIEFMCQSLGFSPLDVEQLDNWMLHVFQKNVPNDFALFANIATGGSKHVCEEFPTLLHFAAAYGLEKLTMQLLDCPGGDLACEIRNINDFTPLDIAENAGFKGLTNILRGYMKMNELTVVYTKIKSLTVDSNKETTEKQSSSAAIPFTTTAAEEDEDEDEEHYLKPKCSSNPSEDSKTEQNFYKLCPAPVPIPSTSSPSEESFKVFHFPSPYLPMDQRKSELPKLIKHSSLNSVHSKQSNFSRQSSVTSATASAAGTAYDDKVQTELAEIINDCKNNVHTIAQTEQLVNEWLNRNDVQRSFKEKQEQLKEMRLRYEQIQKDFQCGIKGASALDRIKKFFNWNAGKKDTKIESQRPISSLSIQSNSSSNSSGRMSTLSACSLGDSGTHSDHEERKISLPVQESEIEREDLMRFHNYLVPPTPRPINKLIFNQQHFPTIEEKTFSEKSENSFYIHFPPNGSPVVPQEPRVELISFKGPNKKGETEKSQETDNVTLQSYMNFPSVEKQLAMKQEALIKSNHREYMNFKVM